jgi:predicted site-specific integrase-resolvase
MKKAVLYARVSSDLQKKERTIESQVLELKRQIAAAGDVLVKKYIDCTTLPRRFIERQADTLVHAHFWVY